MSAAVLLYHHVGPVRPGTRTGLTVTPERFARHLSRLRQLGFQTLSAGDVLPGTVGASSARRVLITFDDAYADLSEHAFPALERAGFGATVFVVSQLVGGVNAWEGPAAGHRLLDADDLRRWSRRGVEVGAHTRTHADLDALTQAETESEVAGSRRDLEQLVDQPVRAFAYPFGRPGRWGEQIAEREYDVAFIVRDGRHGASQSTHLMRRTMVQPQDTRFDLAQRLLMGRSVTSLARQELGRLRQRLARS